MRPSEIQARAAIAAALITSGTIVVPPIPITGTSAAPGPDARRLRAMTDHLYDVITGREHARPRRLRREKRRASA